MWQVQLQLMKQRILFHCLGRLQITGQTLQFVDTAQPKSFAPEQKLCFFFTFYLHQNTLYYKHCMYMHWLWRELWLCQLSVHHWVCFGRRLTEMWRSVFISFITASCSLCDKFYFIFFCCYLLLPAPQQWFDCVSAHVQWAAEQLHWNKLGLCPDVPCCFPCVSSRAVSAPLPPWQRRDKHFHLSF